MQLSTLSCLKSCWEADPRGSIYPVIHYQVLPWTLSWAVLKCLPSVQTEEPKVTHLPIKCHAVVAPKETLLRVHHLRNLQVGAVDVVVQVRQSLHGQTDRGRAGEGVPAPWETPAQLCTTLNWGPKPLQRRLYMLREQFNLVSRH